MRKFIFSLKSLVMSLALVVGGSAWAQITSLPFVADFSDESPSPFGAPAYVAKNNNIGEVVAVVGGTAEASFAIGGEAYTLSNAEEVTVSFTMFNGWLGNGANNTFAVLNSDGVALASLSYNANNCTIVDVTLGGQTVEGFEAFTGQGSIGSKGSNGYSNNPFIANTADNKYNGEVTIKINAFGGVSLSFVGAKDNVDKFYSATLAEGTKIDLAKLTINNASTNTDRATGYGNLTVTSKSMVKYSNDYEDGEVTWTTATGGRYTPVILEEDGNKYLSVNQDERNNNGTTITSTETEGKVAAGEDFTISFRVKLGASNNQTATAFNIYDAANSAFILNLAEVTANATAWTINGGNQTATVSAGGAKAIADLAWVNVKVTSIAGGKTYLSLSDSEGNIIDGFDKTVIPTLSEAGGLGKLEFPTSRYNANFAIDDIVVRDVVESEDIPQTPIYTYTVKFVDQNGDEVKAQEEREEYAEVELAILDEDKATIVSGKSQYTYVSDDAEGQIAAEDGSTVITVTFNKTTVSDYTVNYVDADGNVLQAAAVHKNILVGSEVAATIGEQSKILVEGVIYEYVSGNSAITVAEDEAQNVINLVFAAQDGVTGYFLQTYEAGGADWTTATGGRYTPVIVAGSTIASREQEISHTEQQPKLDPETGEQLTDPETGEPLYEDVKVVDGSEAIDFANKTNFLAVNQAERNNNGVTNGVSSASLAIDQADFTLETSIILGTSNNQGCSFQIKNLAGDANILQLIPTAVGSTTWVVNGDAENYAIELPGTGNYGGTDNNNLNNYSWYNLKVTVYNGTTFVTITDEAGTAILDQVQVPTLATTYGLSKMIFYTGRYNSNFAIDDILVRSVDVANDVPADAQFAEVTINFVDGEGNVLKASETANFQVGQTIELNSAFIADFKVDAEGNIWTAESETTPVTKYIYVNNNGSETLAAEGAEVNVVFRGVASRRIALRHQIQKVDGTMATKNAAGTNLPFYYDSNAAGDVLFEGDVLTYYYPYYLLVDGQLYKTGANSSGTDKGELVVEPGTTTLAKTPVTWTPAYETVVVEDPETGEQIDQEVLITNAVFAQETENIPGITVVKDGYTTIRQANGAAGSAIGGDVLVTTLEPGKYTLTTATRSGTTNFIANGEVVATISSSGTVTTVTSEEFTILQTTPLYIQQQSSTSQYSDYVLIRKTADVASFAITVAEGIENGTVEVPALAAEGATVTIVATPAEGYEVESYSATGVEVGEDGTFTMPANDVTVSVTFSEIFEAPDVVLNAPTFNVVDGTQTAPTILPADSPLTINYSAENLEVNGYAAEDLKVKVQVMVSGDLPENTMNMQSETVHRVMGEIFYIPLGETDFPVALKAGYVYQTVAVMTAELVVPGDEETEEETIAAFVGAPIQLRWVGVEAKPAVIEIANASFELSADGTPLTEEVKTSNGPLKIYGWTIAGVGSEFNNTELRAANSESTTSQFGTSDPSDGEYSLFFRQGWNGNGNVITLTSEGLGEIPAGTYQISVDYKQHYSYDNQTNSNTYVGIALVNGETTIATERSAAAAGVQGASADATYFNNAEWSTLSAVFELSEDLAAGSNVVITLNAGGQRRSDFFIDNVKLVQVPEEELIAAAKEKALAEIAALPVSYEGALFYYDAFTADEVKDAIEAAQSVAEVEAAFADGIADIKDSQNLPDEDAAYMLQLKDGGNYMSISEGKIVLSEKPQALNIVEVEGGYALTNGTEYVAFIGTGNNTWSMGATESAYAWTVNISDGYYTLQCANGLIGVDNTGVGSATYANKGLSDKSLWAISEYAYATLSDIALTTDGVITTESDDTHNTRFEVTFTPEALGLYEENPFILSVLATIDIYKGTGDGKELVKEDYSLTTGEFLDGQIYGYVNDLEYETEYTVVLKAFALYDWSQWDSYDAEYDIWGLVLYKQSEPLEITFTTLSKEDSDIATGIAGLKTAAQKADGKYLEDGKIVIVKNGKRYGVTGILRK